jgi:hypothetical protein
MDVRHIRIIEKGEMVNCVNIIFLQETNGFPFFLGEHLNAKSVIVILVILVFV